MGPVVRSNVRHAGPVSIILAVVLGISSCGRSPARGDWALVSTSESMVEIVVAVGSVDCSSIDAINVVESESDVEIVVTIRTRRGFLTGCDDVARYERRLVALAEPLAGRTLVGCDLGPDTAFRGGEERTSCGEIIDHPAVGE